MAHILKHGPCMSLEYTRGHWYYTRSLNIVRDHAYLYDDSSILYWCCVQCNKLTCITWHFLLLLYKHLCSLPFPDPDDRGDSASRKAQPDERMSGTGETLMPLRGPQKHLDESRRIGAHDVYSTAQPCTQFVHIYFLFNTDLLLLTIVGYLQIWRALPGPRSRYASELTPRHLRDVFFFSNLHSGSVSEVPLGHRALRIGGKNHPKRLEKWLILSTNERSLFNCKWLPITEATILNEPFGQSELFFRLQMAAPYGGFHFRGTHLQNVGFLRVASKARYWTWPWSVWMSSAFDWHAPNESK